MVDGIFSVADTFPITCNIFRINLILYSNPHISICKTILSRKLDIGDLPSVYQRHSKLDKLLELNLRLSYQPSNLSFSSIKTISHFTMSEKCVSRKSWLRNRTYHTAKYDFPPLWSDS